jgi:hypothetical protein
MYFYLFLLHVCYIFVSTKQSKTHTMGTYRIYLKVDKVNKVNCLYDVVDFSLLDAISSVLIWNKTAKNITVKSFEVK